MVRVVGAKPAVDINGSTAQAADVKTPVRYLLVWFDARTPIDAAELPPIRYLIEDRVAEPRDRVEIDVWLESPGGDAHTAYKLALILRHFASRVRIVVPDYAKSAATLLALAGDELYLAPSAELGPLDAQVHEEGSAVGAISALNIARASDAVARDALALATQGAAQMVRDMNLSRADALEAMLGFSAQFSEPLVRQLDPRLVHHANELLRVTVRYATRLLSDQCGPTRANRIAKELVEQFPTHGFVVDREEAKRLRLPVRPLEDYDLLDHVRETHRSSEGGDAIRAFGPLSEFFNDDNDIEDEAHAEPEEAEPVAASAQGIGPQPDGAKAPDAAQGV